MNKELKNTINALTDSYELEIRYLDETIQRIRELHQIHYNGTACSCCEGENECVHCGWNYPCPTIQALDGE